MKLGKNNSTNSIFCTIIRIVSCACARSPVDRTLASGAESVGSTPAERTTFESLPCKFDAGLFCLKKDFNRMRRILQQGIFCFSLGDE